MLSVDTDKILAGMAKAKSPLALTDLLTNIISAFGGAAGFTAELADLYKSCDHDATKARILLAILQLIEKSETDEEEDGGEEFSQEELRAALGLQPE